MPIERLSALDAAFCYLEGPTHHMHVAAVAILDQPSASPVTVDTLRRLVASRLDGLPAFRRRLVRPPIRVGPPFWVDAVPDLEHHVRSVTAGASELSEVVAGLLERPIDLDRPPWELWLVETDATHAVSVVCKIHHSAADGIAAAGMAATLLDPAPTEEPEDAEPGRRAATGPTAAPLALAAAGLPWLAASPGRTAGAAMEVARAVQAVRERNRRRSSVPPPSPFRTPRTRINGTIGPRRAVGFASVSCEDVATVGRRLRASANDIVLAVCAGALREALGDALPPVPLVALVPVALDRRHSAGNGVTGILTSLATHVEDPVTRLAAARDSARAALRQHLTVGPATIPRAFEAIPSPLASAALRAWTSLRLADRYAPPFNVVVSHVPGPDVALWCLGARLRAHYPLGPVLDGVGLNVTAMRYLDRLWFGLVACPDRVPDVGAIANGIATSMDELVDAVEGRA